MLSGTYLPSGMAETMNSPAPPAPYGSAMADFNGGDPNGTWKLYAPDAAAEDSGSIAQGWSLSVTAARTALLRQQQAARFSLRWPTRA